LKQRDFEIVHGVPYSDGFISPACLGLAYLGKKSRSNHPNYLAFLSAKGLIHLWIEFSHIKKDGNAIRLLEEKYILN